MMKGKLKIVFVCLGNYCRSPMAEAIFKHLAHEDDILDQFDISSAGTKDWDIGMRPDRRSQRLLQNNGYPLDPDKRARQITPDEIKEADYLIAMSESVAEELRDGKNVFLLMNFDEKTDVKNIPDPYPSNSFPQAFALIEQGTKAFYQQIKSIVEK